MAPFGRGVPKAVRARLARGERVLAHAPAQAGPDAPLVATTRALYLPDGRSVPWQDIDQASWTPDALTFQEEGGGARTVALRSGPDAVDYRRLAETVAERVTATILVNRFVPYPRPDSSGGFRLVARRSPQGSEAHWRVHLGEGLDPDDPRLSDTVSRTLHTLREQMGI